VLSIPTKRFCGLVPEVATMALIQHELRKLYLQNEFREDPKLCITTMAPSLSALASSSEGYWV